MSTPLRLILMRHAKSDWQHASLADHDRPLAPRGRADAPRIAAALAERGWLPDHVLSSSARRTRDTWLGMVEVLGPRPLTLSPGLYLAGWDALREELAGAPPRARCVLALGHNPGWSEAVSTLTGQDIELTTANAALLEAPPGVAAWARLPSAGWRLEALLRPRQLASGSSKSSGSGSGSGLGLAPK